MIQFHGVMVTRASLDYNEFNMENPSGPINLYLISY